ncbi:MAG: hypothetical protein H6712_26830 [Myxococcales bacterium]|nr:hypothetical protein [Myxococcales bacterium]MCB9717491.1 hypothetical protein [Myxococcales bacterium]
MTVELSEHPIDTPAGPRRALVVTPTSPMSIGLAKLEQLRASLDTSEIDQVVIRHIAAHPHGTFHAFVFRGRNRSGPGWWRLDPALGREEQRELGYRLWCSHLVLNRFCAAAGIFENIWFDWTNAEVRAFSAAADRLGGELRERAERSADPPTPNDTLTQLDRWLVERHTFFLAMELDTLLHKILPTRLAETEGELARLRALVAGSPIAALDGLHWYDASR